MAPDVLEVFTKHPLGASYTYALRGTSESQQHFRFCAMRHLIPQVSPHPECLTSLCPCGSFDHLYPRRTQREIQCCADAISHLRFQSKQRSAPTPRPVVIPR